MKASASPLRQHHRAEQVAVAQQRARFGFGDALALALLVQRRNIAVAQIFVVGIDDLRLETQPQFLDRRLDLLAASDQDRLGKPFFLDLRGGADDLQLFAFGVEDALLRAGFGFADDAAARLLTDTLTADQFFAVGVEVDLAAGDAAFHRRLRNRRGDPQQHARIERLGDQVVAPEAQRRQPISRQHAVRHVFHRQMRRARAPPPASFPR